MPNPTHAYAHPGFHGLIGAVRADITPPVGIYARNWGAATHDVAEGVHRPLTAITLTLQTARDSPPLVLISLDLGWWRSFHDEWRLRGEVLEALQLDSGRLMIHLTHTHSGPVICRDDAEKPGGHLIAPYLDSLRDTVIAGIRSAVAAAEPATLEWSYGRCALAQNRDLPDPEYPRIACGFNPGGPADDALLVGSARRPDGEYLATLVNYACHPTTLAWQNRLVSPDWVGAMREIVEMHTGNAPCLYLHGASGELAPREQYTDNTAIADKNGRQVGHSVLGTLEGMLPPATSLVYDGVTESGAPLAAWKRNAASMSTEISAVQIDVPYALQSLPTLVELDAQLADCTDRVTAERLSRKRRVREGVGEGDTAHMPLWVWKVGDAFLLGHPNEAYSQLQTELRKRFPGAAIAVMNVVNGHFGYLPPAELYRQDIYSVWQTPFAAGSLEKLIGTCTNAIAPNALNAAT